MPTIGPLLGTSLGLGRGALEPQTFYVQTLVVGFAPFNQTDWPLPTGPVYPVDLRSWTQNLLETTLASTVFYRNYTIRPHQKSLPDKGPPPQVPSWTWRQAGMLGKDTLPFNQYDWPLPGRAQWWTNYRTWDWRQVGMLGQDTLPQNQYDWPLPRPAQRGLDWIQSVNLALTAQQQPRPFNQYDWPLPGRSAPREYTTAFSGNALTAPPLVAIFRPHQKSLPDRSPSFFQVFDPPNFVIRQGPPAAIPAGNNIYDLPVRATSRAIDLYNWVNSVNLALTTQQQQRPFVQTDWPLAAGAPQPDRSFTASRFLGLVPAPPATAVIMAGLFGGVATFSREGHTPSE